MADIERDDLEMMVLLNLLDAICVEWPILYCFTLFFLVNRVMKCLILNEEL